LFENYFRSVSKRKFFSAFPFENLEFEGNKSKLLAIYLSKVSVPTSGSWLNTPNIFALASDLLTGINLGFYTLGI